MNICVQIFINIDSEFLYGATLHAWGEGVIVVRVVFDNAVLQDRSHAASFLLPTLLLLSPSLGCESMFGQRRVLPWNQFVGFNEIFDRVRFFWLLFFRLCGHPFFAPLSRVFQMHFIADRFCG